MYISDGYRLTFAAMFTLCYVFSCFFFFFFFQAEDGIRDGRVTGVQTCALPIYRVRVVARRSGPAQGLNWSSARFWTTVCSMRPLPLRLASYMRVSTRWSIEIGRASCRERV